jgi:hypothetical protein
MRLCVSRFALAMALLALATPSSDSQQPEPSAKVSPASPSSDLHALQSYLDSVAKAKEAAQRAWEALRASTQSPGAPDETDFATQWLNTASLNGAAASPFYAGTETVLKAWIAAINSGQDTNPPTDEIRIGMEKWQEAHENVVDSLQQSASLEKTLRPLAARIAKMNPDSPDLDFYKDQQQQAQLTMRKLLSDAGASLSAAAAIPGPVTDTDRTASPFAGAPTPGTPDRLFIHRRRASALIGESIPVQIGLANDRGPNVAAPQSFAIALACEGCTATPNTVQLASGKTFAEAQVKITAASAKIRAEVKGSLPPIQASAYGCYPAPSVALATEQDRSTGPADGITPIPFLFAFHNAAGQRATDGQRKSLSAKLTGVGQRIALDSSVASVQSKDGSIIIPANECVAEGGVVSASVGTAKLAVDSNSVPVRPLDFRFLYAFPWLDKICVALGALFAFISSYSIMKTRPVPWVASAVASAAGAAIVFAIGYFYLLNDATFQDTWVIALGLAAIGGIIGVCAAKLVLSRYMPPAEAESASSDAESVIL